MWLGMGKKNIRVGFSFNQETGSPEEKGKKFGAPMLNPTEILSNLYPCLKKNNWPPKWLIIGVLIMLALIICAVARAENTPPNNLWQGIIAEDCSGDFMVYLIIASVVRNRLNAGMNNGLIALKRQNLGQFVKQNCDYMLKVKGIDLTFLVTKAMTEVFVNDKDYANSATNYEHTGHYPIPEYTKKMKLVKVLYPHTKREIMLWK